MPRRFEEAVPTGFGDIGRFVDGDERRELAGEPLRLDGVMDDPYGKFGARWIVSAVVLATGERIAIGLAKNANRDRQLASLRDTLADPTDEGIEPVVLESRKPAHGGNAFWTFRSATDDELAGVASTTADDEPDSTTADDEPDGPAEPAEPAKRGRK